MGDDVMEPCGGTTIS